MVSDEACSVSVIFTTGSIVDGAEDCAATCLVTAVESKVDPVTTEVGEPFVDDVVTTGVPDDVVVVPSDQVVVVTGVVVVVVVSTGVVVTTVSV